MKENINKIEQEAQKRDESVSQLKKENAVLHEKVTKIKTRMKGKILLQGAKHSIWDSISFEVTKLKTYLNYVNDEDNIAVLAKQRCKVINETLSKRPTKWAQNAINLPNTVPSSILQTIGVKYRTTLIIWARRIITKRNLSNSV